MSRSPSMRTARCRLYLVWLPIIILLRTAAGNEFCRQASDNDRTYNGKINMNANGKPCSPWNQHNSGWGNDDSDFEMLGETREEARSYCRIPADVNEDYWSQQPWCYNPNGAKVRCNVPECQASCPENYVYADRSCYKIVHDDDHTWAQAQTACKQDGDQLVAIETEDEKNALAREINPPTPPSNHYWTAGRYVDRKTNIRWGRYGSAITEPVLEEDTKLNDHVYITVEEAENDEDVVTMNFTMANQDTSRGYICERTPKYHLTFFTGSTGNLNNPDPNTCLRILTETEQFTAHARTSVAFHRMVLELRSVNIQHEIPCTAGPPVVVTTQPHTDGHRIRQDPCQPFCERVTCPFTDETPDGAFRYVCECPLVACMDVSIMVPSSVKQDASADTSLCTAHVLFLK